MIVGPILAEVKRGANDHSHILLGVSPVPVQLNLDPNHRPVDVYAVVRHAPVRLAVALRQIKIRYMHEIQTRRNRAAGTEVISHSAADVDSKCKVLSLRIPDPLRPLSIDVADAEAHVKVRGDPPITLDEITPNSHKV